MSDPVSAKIDGLLQELNTKLPPEKLSIPMRRVRAFLCRSIEVEENAVRKTHIVHFAKNAPERALLKIAGMGRKTLADLKKEIAELP